MRGRLSLVGVTAYVLLLGGAIAWVSAQSSDPRAVDRGGEPRQGPRVAPDARRSVYPDGVASDPAARVRPGLRRAWPGDLDERGRAGETLDGTGPIPTGADGVMCWPHGDHFHCR